MVTAIRIPMGRDMVRRSWCIQENRLLLLPPRPRLRPFIFTPLSMVIRSKSTKSTEEPLANCNHVAHSLTLDNYRSSTTRPPGRPTLTFQHYAVVWSLEAYSLVDENPQTAIVAGFCFLLFAYIMNQRSTLNTLHTGVISLYQWGTTYIGLLLLHRTRPTALFCSPW